MPNRHPQQREYKQMSAQKDFFNEVRYLNGKIAGVKSAIKTREDKAMTANECSQLATVVGNMHAALVRVAQPEKAEKAKK